MKMQERLAMRLRAAYRMMHRRAECAYAKVGSTPDQFVVLALLAEKDGLTQKELGARSYSDPSTLTAIARLLESHGLVRRAADERDGRAKRVYLTAAGRRLLTRKLLPMADRAHQAMIAHLTPEELKILTRTLDRIARIAPAPPPADGAG